MPPPTHSPLQGLSDELLGAGAGRGQHALVIGALADVAAEDLQDARGGHLAGQLGRVIGHRLGLATVPHSTQAPAAAVPEQGAAIEYRGQAVVVTTDFALGWLTHACRTLQ